MKRDSWRKLGRILRYILFIINFIPWIVGIINIIIGFVLGLETKLILWPFNQVDFTISTPPVLLIIYGSFILLVTTFGHFAASSANKFVIIIYLILGILLFIFDGTKGILILLNPNAFDEFMISSQESIKNYDDDGNKRFGIFSNTAKEFWDHVQTRGNCCGYKHYEEFRTTSIGTKDEIPISCCKLMFRHRDCGQKIWSRHPNGISTKHTLSAVLITEGCKSILFPTTFLSSFEPASKFGLFIGICFIICFLIALILLIMLLTKKYHPDWGILALQQKRLSRLSLITMKGPFGDTKTNNKQSFNNNKVGSSNNEDEPQKPMLNRYLYKSGGQVQDEDADNYAPELKRPKMETTTSSSPPPAKQQFKFNNKNKKETTIGNSHQILKKVPVQPKTKKSSYGKNFDYDDDIQHSGNKKPRFNK